MFVIIGFVDPPRKSHPLRVRGLKYWHNALGLSWRSVAPFEGAWIEIIFISPFFSFILVAPFEGAWIEISPTMNISAAAEVAPFEGAWIEIPLRSQITLAYLRRTL